MIAGIDYGSKLAGTTAICYDQDGKLHFIQSQKKKDADLLILNWIKENQPDIVMLDAPLSLPLAYRFPNKRSDYHYRECDRNLKAMSPMFLGGLTARAMNLRSQLAEFEILETYPKAVLQERFPTLIPQYKHEIMLFSLRLKTELPYPFAEAPSNWHQIDSCLAWYAGWNNHLDKGICVGNIDEGKIHF